ncbi:hypothetical protein TanjilG_00461 [Lupinus angustifolius]|uniref:WRKY domain-containing protein n=1 Tax=Lupinus angustifolius TaxID=3871 RepID=A0A4P1QX43_LUPAN|nr:PREDICTED: WRKY transcription factor 55-like isoform X2 [Lupinus angustifolius]OIV96879.1 hypothetical protein TanjilG_00461 [Lupinus angustifolius]
MEHVITSIHHACALAQSLESGLPNLANQPARLCLSINEIVKTLSDAKERLMILSQHDQTPLSSFAQLMMMPHEMHHQPQMDAISMQEWISCSYTQTTDQLLQAAMSSIPLDVRTLPETKMIMGMEAMEASPSRSRKRKVDLEKRTIMVPAPQFGNTEMPPEDGFTWRKYGQKEILGSKYPRCYYRCTHQKLYGCLAKKQVQRHNDNPSMYEVTYRGNHTCHMSSTAPLSIPPQQLLLDVTQRTISPQLSPTTASASSMWLSSINVGLQQGGGGGMAPAAAGASDGPSTSRDGADYPVVDMADVMFNNGSSSGNSIESLFPPTEDN